MRPHLNSNELLLANPHGRFRNTAPKILPPSEVTAENPPHPLVVWKSGRREAALTTTPDIYFPPTRPPLWCNLCVPEGLFFTQLFSGRNAVAGLMEARRPWITATSEELFRKKTLRGPPGSTDSLRYAWLLTQINRRCIFRKQFGTRDLFLQGFSVPGLGSANREVTARPLIYSTRCFTFSLSPGTKSPCFYSYGAQAAFNPCSWKILCSWKLLLLCCSLSRDERGSINSYSFHMLGPEGICDPPPLDSQGPQRSSLLHQDDDASLNQRMFFGWFPSQSCGRTLVLVL